MHSLLDLKKNELSNFKAKVITYSLTATTLSEVMHKGSNLTLYSCWREICLASYGTVSLQVPYRNDSSTLRNNLSEQSCAQTERKTPKVVKCYILAPTSVKPACTNKGEKVFLQRNYIF